jgi:hypothetical protein
LEDVVFWDMAPCGFRRIDVSEENTASIFRATMFLVFSEESGLRSHTLL